jgi:hypothetical protein
MTEPALVGSCREISPRDVAALATLPGYKWVECAKCLDHKLTRSDEEVAEWSAAHREERPGHDRFRTVEQTEWRFVAPEISP